MDSINRIALGQDDEAADEVGDASQRKRTRDSLFLMARLQVGDDAAVHDVRIRNLSEGGLMAEFDRAVATDTPVTLDLRGIGEITGRVAWCTEGRLGIALDRPIDPKRARKPVGVAPKAPFYTKPLPRR